MEKMEEKFYIIRIDCLRTETSPCMKCTAKKFKQINQDVYELRFSSVGKKYPN